MYLISRSIRIRTCGSILLLVNIKTNSVYKVEKNAFYYLTKVVATGLSNENLSNHSSAFIKFISDLRNVGVLEETKSES